MHVLALPSASGRFANRKAFTLVELLVATAVVALLMVAVISILSSATLVTGQSRQRVDADSEARMIFDRMAEDFSGMVKRSDVDYIFAKTSGTGSSGANDTLYFYSEAPALADTSSTLPSTTWALVGYRINSSYQLERLGKGLVWGAAPPSGPVFLTYASSILPLSPDANSTFANPNWAALVGAGPAYTNATSSYYHVLGDAVFRMEYCFLLKPLKQTNGSVLPAIYSNLPYDNRANQMANPVPTNLYGLGPADIQAIVVAIAILGTNSRKIVSTANLQTLANALPDSQDTALSASPPQLMAQTWDALVAANNFPGVPTAATADIRVYQRTFYLDPSSTDHQ